MVKEWNQQGESHPQALETVTTVKIYQTDDSTKFVRTSIESELNDLKTT